MEINKRPLFWLFIVSVLLTLILPQLVQDGMFMDGLLYTCVSKNLANGEGSFWFPYYSKTLYPHFDQQPPLGFGIQSIFFSVLGDSMYVERFYSLICALISASLIGALWRLIFLEEYNLKSISWLPVLFWIIIPVCFWSYSNNMLECTMAIFDLAAIIFVLKYFLCIQRIWYILLAGVFVTFAVFTKGLQGSFPLAAVFFGWVAYRNISFMKMLALSLILIAVPILICAIIISQDHPYESLRAYFFNRVVNSIQNVSEVGSRFYLLGRLLTELSPLIAIVLIVLVSTRKNMCSMGWIIRHRRHIFFLVMVGLSASLPLMITLEQRGFYLTTSFPYFAITFAILAGFGFYKIVSFTSRSSLIKTIFNLVSISLLLVVCIIAFLKAGKPGRDHAMLNDVHVIGKKLPKGTVLGSTKELWSQWVLQEYFIRYYSIAQDNKISGEHRYILLTSEQDIPKSIRARKVELPTLRYHLYEKLP